MTAKVFKLELAQIPDTYSAGKPIDDPIGTRINKIYADASIAGFLTRNSLRNQSLHHRRSHPQSSDSFDVVLPKAMMAPATSRQKSESAGNANLDNNNRVGSGLTGAFLATKLYV